MLGLTAISIAFLYKERDWCWSEIFSYMDPPAIAVSVSAYEANEVRLTRMVASYSAVPERGVR